MLFHDDVVTYRETKPCSFSGRLGRKERVEHLFLHLGRDTGPIIANSDLHGITEVPGSGAQHRFEAWISVLHFAFADCIETVRNQIQEDTSDLLRKQIDRAGALVEVALQGHIELRLLGPRAVISEIETLIQNRVDIRRPMLAGSLPRMQQHVLDNRVGAFPVLDDLLQIVFQQTA